MKERYLLVLVDSDDSSKAFIFNGIAK